MQSVSTSASRRKLTKFHEDCELHCEWNMCTMSFTKMQKFLCHIAEHVAAIGDGPKDLQVCFWRNCGFTCPGKEELDRHIYFHGFHTKIKGLGELLLKERNLQCENDSETHNIIPEIPIPFQCNWVDCGFTFVSAQDFYWHVHGHVFAIERSPIDKLNHCEWQGCKVKLRVSLKEHVRTHTQEKVIGCPTCGGLFSSATKLMDHCFRRIIPQEEGFECSHCKKKFSRERILREHIRSHINQFKCSLCEMTCTSKSTLMTHMRYRHTSHRPFTCPKCPLRFKTASDIIKHFNIHQTESVFVCPYNECKFSCKAQETLFGHIHKVHDDIPKKVFMCHICNHTAHKGTSLTKHLKKQHDFHWPAGHTRFRYQKCDDGFYKLQTTRIESIELTESILRENGTSSANGKASQDLILIPQDTKDDDDDPDSLSIVSDAPEEDPLQMPTTEEMMI